MTIKERDICELNCPYCHETLRIIKEVRVISPAVKAEKEETYRAEKVKQTRIDEM